MKKFIYLFVYLFIATVSNSCQSEDPVETSSLSDLVYKEKLEKLITLKPATDLKTSKTDLSNALKFKNYEEAYNYFKDNREFVSDTIITELKGVPVLDNVSKTAKLESSSSTNNPIYGYDSQSYNQVFNDYANISGGVSANIAANYNFYCTILYAYKQENNNKNYYSAYVGSSGIGGVTATFGGVGVITPSGSLAVSSGGGTSLGWQQNYQQTILVTGYPPAKSIIIVNGSLTIMPHYFASAIGVLTVSHSITARYYQYL